MMLFPQLNLFESISLLFLRIIIGIIFISSGWLHLTSPAERARHSEYLSATGREWKKAVEEKTGSKKTKDNFGKSK